MYHMQRNEGDIIQHINLRVERDRVLPDRRQPGAQGTGHRRDELPEPLPAHPAARDSTACSAWSTATRSPGKEGEQALIDAYVAADSFEVRAMKTH